MSRFNGNDASRVAAFSPTAALRLIRAVLADTSLTHAQRVVVAALATQANNDSGIAWASYRQLSRDYKLSPETIAKTLKADGGVAIGRYLIAERRGKQGAIGYRLVLPEAETASDNVALQSAKRYDSDGEALRSGGCGASEAEVILTPDTYPLNSNPLYPPQAGEGAGESLQCSKEVGKKPQQTLKEAVACVDALWHEVIGRGIGWIERQKVRREFRSGDKAIFAMIDADSVRGARDMAAKCGGTFGFGWVVKYLTERAATEQAKVRAEADRRILRQTAARNEAAQRQRDMQQQQQAAERLEWFAGLSGDDQQAWEAAARLRLPRMQNPELIRRQAAHLAWMESIGRGEPTEVEV